MADLNYVKGYLLMIEKCAQFTRQVEGNDPYPRPGRLYYAIPEESGRPLTKAMEDIDSYLDVYRGSDENIEKDPRLRKNLEKQKGIAAKSIAKSRPVSEYTMNLIRSRMPGEQFIGVNEPTTRDRASTVDAIQQGLDDSAIRYLMAQYQRAAQVASNPPANKKVRVSPAQGRANASRAGYVGPAMKA